MYAPDVFSAADINTLCINNYYICLSVCLSVSQVHGQRGNSTVLPLDNSIDNFEQGERDSFLLSLPDISPVIAITVAHDNTNPYPEWHLDRVQLEPTCPQLEPTSYVFPCNQWLSAATSTSIRIPATPLPGGGGGAGGGAEGTLRKDQIPSQAVSPDGDGGGEGRGDDGDGGGDEEGRSDDDEDSGSYGSDQFESLEESEEEERGGVSPVQPLDSTITNEVGASPNHKCNQFTYVEVKVKGMKFEFGISLCFSKLP